MGPMIFCAAVSHPREITASALRAQRLSRRPSGGHGQRAPMNIPSSFVCLDLQPSTRHSREGDMYRNFGLARLAPIALLSLTTQLTPLHAQTVMGSGTAARCIENGPNGELACGSGATAAPGTGATAIGINAKGTADAAMGF